MGLPFPYTRGRWSHENDRTKPRGWHARPDHLGNKDIEGLHHLRRKVEVILIFKLERKAERNAANTGFIIPVRHSFGINSA